MKRLSEMKPGETATIKEFSDEIISLKLLDLGCLPGETIVMENPAPMGDPLKVKVSGIYLTLRRAEACMVIVE
jgi:ferrous iron transport protein A